MYRNIPQYNEGQELALKCVWSVLQVAAGVVHDVFIILYSHMPDTHNGSKPIYDYCSQNDLMSVYTELINDGLPEDCLKINPRMAKYYDLKVSRTLVEKLIAVGPSSEKKLLGFLRFLSHSRNELCHQKMEPEEIDYKLKATEIWQCLRTLYHSACQIKGIPYGPPVDRLDKTFKSLLDVYTPPPFLSRAPNKLANRHNTSSNLQTNRSQNNQIELAQENPLGDMVVTAVRNMWNYLTTPSPTAPNTPSYQHASSTNLRNNRPTNFQRNQSQNNQVKPAEENPLKVMVVSAASYMWNYLTTPSPTEAGRCIITSTSTSSSSTNIRCNRSANLRTKQSQNYESTNLRQNRPDYLGTYPRHTREDSFW